MTEALVVANGVTYRGDLATRTIAPDDTLSRQVADLLDSDEPIGPGVDEFAGIHGTWNHYPRAMIAAFLELDDASPDVTVTWFSDRGNPPPQGA